MKYLEDKRLKEEEDLARKEEERQAKELETAKLREKQEKASDKQSILDELRAKR